jgi:Tfp pilus assembly ATPase PilU
MQEFDQVIKGMVERKVITVEDGLAFATNQNNLLLALKGLSSSEEFMSVPAIEAPVAAAATRPGKSVSMLDMID